MAKSTSKSTTTESLKSQEKAVFGIRSQYLPEGNERIMLNRVYKRYWAMRDSVDRKKAEEEWERGRKQWESFREPRHDDEWQSNHYVPLTTAVVESALSEIIDESPQPLILPRGSEDIPRASVMSHIFEYTWEISDSDLEFEDILHDAFIEGTGIGQEYFYSDIRRIKTGLIKKDDKTDWTEELKTNYSDCYLECVKNDDFFIDENARGFNGPYAARDSVRRYIMNIDDFRDFFRGPVWNPLDNAKYVIAGGDTNYYEWYKPPQGIDHGKMVEVLWYWSVKPDDWLVIVANDVLVFMGPNPYKHKELPFARAIDVKRTHKFYGKGEAALLESIQDELNTIRRMVIDRNHLDIDKMFIGSNRLQLSEEDLIARPHGFIPSDDPDSVKPVEYSDIPQSVALSKGWLEDDATIASGINPRAESLPQGGTATEAAILKESTLKRIRLKVRRIEREFLTRVARLRVSNILQFYPQPKLEKIIGTEGTQEFQQEISQLQQKGLLEQKTNETGGIDNFKKTYRQIRLQDVDLVPQVDGTFQTQTAPGMHFFDLNPDYFVPNRGGYDVKFAAGSTLPISKPLMQQQVSNMYDRLIQLALGVPNTYDPKKLGDALLRVNDMNPADFSVDQQQQQPQDDQEARLQMALQLAQTENRLMMQGKDLPPTPYQPAVHTLVHVQFTGSPTFQQLHKDDSRIKIFTDHITGEIAALQERDQGTVAAPIPPSQPGQPQQAGPIQGQGNAPAVSTPQTPNAQGGANTMLQAANPSKIQGGGMVPPAI